MSGLNNSKLYLLKNRCHAMCCPIMSKCIDDFCAVWYLFDLLAVENPDWTPQFTY